MTEGPENNVYPAFGHRLNFGLFFGPARQVCDRMGFYHVNEFWCANDIHMANAINSLTALMWLDAVKNCMAIGERLRDERDNERQRAVSGVRQGEGNPAPPVSGVPRKSGADTRRVDRKRSGGRKNVKCQCGGVAPDAG